MELNEALSQISEIRAHMARVEAHRDSVLRAVPVASSGLLAGGAAIAQAIWIAAPSEAITAYLVLWISVAVIVCAAVGAELCWRSRRDAVSRQVNWLAIEQFAPCVAAGALLTCALVSAAPQSAWMLPGLWQILYSLGLFASWRLLPRHVFLVGVFYLLSGITCLILARGPAALSPLAMGVPFGMGQLLLGAAVVKREQANGSG